jgi:hypothetical protein
MDSYQAPRKLVVTPPVIREAEDGGLGYDDIIENPWRHITAQMGDWGRLIPGDAIEVLWGPSLESFARRVYRDDDDRAVVLKIDVAKIHGIGEGVMPVASRITTIETGESQQSEATTVVVKFGVPGGLDPDARTPYLNENLAAPVVGPLPLPDDFTGISVTIPPYMNMAAGDSLSVRWQGVSVTRPGLSADEVGHPVRIAIDRETAMMAAGQDATVVYQVYDVVANWSRWSTSTVVSVPPDETSSPVAPWVIGTVDDEGRQLRVASLTGKDANVRVENHPALVGDLIAVVWDGVTAAGKALSYVCPEQEVRRPGQSMDFFIPYSYVAELAAGEAIVSYRLLSGGKTIRSRRRRLSILGEAPALVPPTVREARDGVLDLSLATDGVHVIVPAWAGLRPEDRCYLEWTGQKHDGQPTFFNASRSGGDVEADGTLVFVVPHEEAARIAGGKLRIRYHVAVYSAVRSEHGLRTEPVVQLASPWLKLTVSEAAAPLSIDSTPVTLNGVIVRLDARVTVPPEATFAVRVATGGSPPYRYAANSGAIEVDVATGRVVSLRNGDAVVTVTDAKRATASYPVRVANVLHFVDLGNSNTFAGTGGDARHRGMRIPSLEEWDALRAAYAGKPPMRDEAGWSAHQVDKFNHWVVFPMTGAREARKSFGLGAPLGLARAWAVTAPTV